MASPLPKTKAPALAKNQKSENPVVAPPPLVAASATGGRTTSSDARRVFHIWIIQATTPPPVMSERISVCVTAVASALTTKIAQSSPSRPSVRRTSLYALRRMMAMTAAPMP